MPIPKPESNWQRHYHSDRASLRRGEVTITRRGSRVLVACPYREDFIAGARGILDWKWRGAVKVWSFPTSEMSEVRDLIDHIFGREWVPQWMQDWRGDHA